MNYNEIKIKMQHAMQMMINDVEATIKKKYRELVALGPFGRTECQEGVDTVSTVPQTGAGGPALVDDAKVDGVAEVGVVKTTKAAEVKKLTRHLREGKRRKQVRHSVGVRAWNTFKAVALNTGSFYETRVNVTVKGEDVSDLVTSYVDDDASKKSPLTVAAIELASQIRLNNPCDITKLRVEDVATYERWASRRVADLDFADVWLKGWRSRDKLTLVRVAVSLAQVPTPGDKLAVRVGRSREALVSHAELRLLSNINHHRPTTCGQWWDYLVTGKLELGGNAQLVPGALRVD